LALTVVTRFPFCSVSDVAWAMLATVASRPKPKSGTSRLKVRNVLFLANAIPNPRSTIPRT
jgi:hypothetical protein